MLDRTCRAVLPLVAAAALLAPATAIGSGTSDRTLSPRWGKILRIDGGYRFVASEHDSRLVMARDGTRVLFHDRALRRWKELPRGCRAVAVDRGIAATCRIPAATSPAAPMLLEVLPRLGDDRVDATKLGPEFTLRVLGADGNDVVALGSGDDFFNGAAGDDRASGGIGEDELVGVGGADHLSGNIGEDTLRGGDGDDTLLGGPGEDSLFCGPGVDTTDDDGQTDGVSHCEELAP